MIGKSLGLAEGFRTVLSIVLSLAVGHQVIAQDAAALRVIVVEGQDAVNNISRKAYTPAVVEVRDASHRPVSGARVRFTVPSLGPGGTFPDGTRTLTLFTDDKGRAAMTGFVPNELEGRFSVAVSAHLAGREGTTSISQENRPFARPVKAANFEPRAVETGTGSGQSKKLLLVLGVGVAVAAVSVFAVKGNSSRGPLGAASTPTTISIGGVGIGGPN